MIEQTEKDIRIVMVEANEGDIEIIVGTLRDAGMRIAVETVMSEEGLARALSDFKPDVVLTDYALPLLNYRDTLKIVQELRPRTPVIVVGGKLRGEDSGSCVRSGAESFVSKFNLGVLPQVILAAVEAREPPPVSRIVRSR
jgi:CheY-like chemotaxis protein